MLPAGARIADISHATDLARQCRAARECMERLSRVVQAFVEGWVTYTKGSSGNITHRKVCSFAECKTVCGGHFAWWRWFHALGQHQGCSVRVRGLLRILTKPNNAVRELLWVRRTSSLFYENLGPNLQPKVQERALDGRQMFRCFVHRLIIIHHTFSRQ